MAYYSRRKTMDLLELLESKYFPLKTTITAKHTRERYRRAVRWLGDALGRPAVVSDLTDDHLVAVASYLRDSRSQCPRTINGTLQCLCALWRWCRDRELHRGGPTVALLRVQQRPPRAWREEELRRLVAAADAQPGSIGGMPARVWWLTLLALEMDTGARATELLSLRWEWIDWPQATLTVDASVRKGGVKFAVYGLRAETIRWLEPRKKPQGLILGWQYDKSRFYQLFKEILEAAGLPNTRYTKLHCLRRTFATLLEMAGGNATAALGHESRATTLRHYLDPTRVVQRHADLIPFHPLQGVATG